jgi:hypothetical protein
MCKKILGPDILQVCRKEMVREIGADVVDIASRTLPIPATGSGGISLSVPKKSDP